MSFKIEVPEIKEIFSKFFFRFFDEKCKVNIFQQVGTNAWKSVNVKKMKIHGETIAFFQMLILLVRTPSTLMSNIQTSGGIPLVDI